VTEAAKGGGELSRALCDAIRLGLRIPCQDGSGYLWVSELALDRQRAVERCRGCPVIIECGEVAEVRGERHHVWGGVDRTRPYSQPAIAPNSSHDEFR
jgi:Transcription factor WhiB